MLRFTPRGVVPDPRCLQIRVQAGARVVRAGRGDPSRALRDEEVLDAVRDFTVRRQGPRVSPCDALVISGLPAAREALWIELCRVARSHGIGRITVHADAEDPATCAGADHRVMPLLHPPTEEARRLLGRVAPQAVVLPLAAGLDVTRTWLEVLCSGVAPRVREWVLTWPLSAEGVPSPASGVVALLDAWVPRAAAAGLGVVVKGLPACALGPHHRLLRRSRNRFYVDADHQGAAALLFQPDVLRFARSDACRFCAARDRCDGVAEAWVAAGLAPELRPVEAP